MMITDKEDELKNTKLATYEKGQSLESLHQEAEILIQRISKNLRIVADTVQKIRTGFRMIEQHR